MTDPMAIVEARLVESILVKQNWGESLKRRIVEAAEMIVARLEAGRRVLALGNGGSATDAQHFALEMVGRFQREREAWDVLALTDAASLMTCLVNDYGVEGIFMRQVEAHGREGDVLLAISTSGNSPNVLDAVDLAHRKGLTVIGLTGDSGGQMADRCDILLNIPSHETPRIQESHITAIHMICELAETALADRRHAANGSV